MSRLLPANSVAAWMAALLLGLALPALAAPETPTPPPSDKGAPTEPPPRAQFVPPAIQCPDGNTAVVRSLETPGQTPEHEQFCVDKKGQRQGLYERYWMDKWHRKSAEGHYRDGKLDGLWCAWWENSFKMEEGSYRAGQKDGLWRYWHSNGQRAVHAKYKDGMREGRSSAWDVEGRLHHEAEYRRGQRIRGEEVVEQGDPFKRLEDVVPKVKKRP